MRVFSGYGLIALSIAVFLAVLSFSPADSALLVSEAPHAVHNIVGQPGAFVSTFLVLVYGKWAALLLCFGFFATGVNILVRNKVGRVLIKLTLFFIASVSLSVVLAASIPGADYRDAGLIGSVIANTFGEILPPAFTIVLFSFTLLLALLSTMKLFRVLTSGVAAAIGAFLLFPFRLLRMVKDTPVRSPSPTVEWKRETVFTDEAGETPRPVPHETPRQSVPPQFLNDPKLKPSVQYDTDAEPPAFLVEPDKKEELLERMDAFYSDRLGISGKGPAPVEVNDPVPGMTEEELEAEWNEEEAKDGGPREVPGNLEIDEPEAISASGAVPLPGIEASMREVDFEGKEFVPLPEKPIVPVRAVEAETAEEDTEEEEISGEADYRETAKGRVEETPESLFPDHEVNQTDYHFPAAAELEKGFEDFSRSEEMQEIEDTKKMIENTLANFKIDIEVSGYSRGPAITRYEIVPPSGLKLKSIVNLTDDLALSLGSRNIRIVAPIGNRSIIGVEVPNRHRRTVPLRDIIESPEFSKSRAKLPLILGKDIAGNIVVEDLADMPHLLIAGTTGSGKSVYVNSLISGLVFTRTSDEVKFIFIDPKMVELELYNGIPHLLAPVITSPEEAIAVLEWASAEMDRRYRVLSEWSVRNISDYNKEVKSAKKKDLEVFPYIVIVIDEFANLMLRMPKETEKVISRLAAMARATGIHLVVATQRPSVDVVTGIIKANFPSRIAFRVSSQTDSRTILDRAGAEKLLGRGDMLYMTPNFTDMIRIQSPYVSNTDVESVVRSLKKNGTAEYLIDPEELLAQSHSNPSSSGGDSELSTDYSQDPFFVEALRAALENGELSASYLQRRFRIGYNRASRIVEAMEQMKILGSAPSAGKPREVQMAAGELRELIDQLSPAE